MPRLLNLLPWRRRRLEQDLARELSYHMDRRVEDLRRSGLSDVEARRRATLEFGGIVQVQEEVRDTWVLRWLDTFSRDLRYAARVLLRNPGFTATALLSLALGIGANAALFSLVDQVLLRPLSVSEPERLVYLAWKGNALATGWGTGYQMSYPFCRDLQEQSQVFDGAFCRHPTKVNFSTGKEYEPVRAEIVSGSYFAVLGVRPKLGRLIAPSDDVHPGGHPVVVLSHAYWTTRLGGAPDIVGRKVLVNNYPMTVIGIAPPTFPSIDPHARPALWVPATMTMQAANIDAYWDRLLDRRAFWMHAFGRLKVGVSAEDAKARLQPWFRSMLEADTHHEGFPSVTAEQRRAFLASTLDVLPASGGLSNLRRRLERPLWVLMAGTVLLLLLASLNVAGLLLARGAARSRELTTRMAIGATRGRVARQLFVESMLVTLGGGALGVMVAPAVSRLLLSFLSQDADVHATIDLRVLVFACLTSVVTAGVCGLAPALQTRRIPLIASLNERSRVATTAGARLRKLLVVGQMAFTLILLIAAGLFAQTLTRLYAKGPGFYTSNLLMVSVSPPSIGYSAPDAERVMREVLQRLQEAPMVERAAIANSGLLGGQAANTHLTIAFDGRIVTERAVYRMRVGPGFFAVLGTPVIAGRDFDQRDVRAPGDPNRWRSAIVNESFAHRYFNGTNPVGHRLGVGNRPDTATDIEIIGVVRDFDRRNLREGEFEQVFLPFWDQNSGDGTFFLKIRGSADSALAAVRAAVAQVDPGLPVSLMTVDDQIEQSLRTERMLASLSSAFGLIALLLSVVGLYGVMSLVVTQRTPEIGVRLALGATRSSALWLIMRDASIMIGAGTLIALPSAWALRRLVEAELFGVHVFDGATIAVASSVLALVALGAAMLPAWRATLVSPIEALRRD